MRADFGRVTLAEIIFELVDDDGAADDGVRAVERNLRIRNGKVATRRGGLDVAEITGVTNGISRRAVVHAVRVEVRARGHASVRRVAELVNVKPVLPRGQAGDGTDDGGGAVALLGKLDDAGDTGGTGEDDDGLLLGGDDGENTRARRRGSDRGATKVSGVSLKVRSIDRSTREPRTAGRDDRGVEARVGKKKSSRVGFDTRETRGRFRSSARRRRKRFDRSFAESSSTNDNPSIRRNERRATFAPNVPLARARGAAEVLLRRERRGGGSGEGGHVRE